MYPWFVITKLSVDVLIPLDGIVLFWFLYPNPEFVTKISVTILFLSNVSRDCVSFPFESIVTVLMPDLESDKVLWSLTVYASTTFA